MGSLKPLNAKFIKWSNTLKQIVSKLQTICLVVFDHYSRLALKGLSSKRRVKCLVKPLERSDWSFLLISHIFFAKSFSVEKDLPFLY